jgi:hypothetical protein
MNMTMAIDMTWKVESVDEKQAAVVQLTMDRIQMKMKGPQGAMIDYDSSAGKPPEGLATIIAPLFESMLKKPFTMKLSPRGEALETKVPQGMLEGLKKFPGMDQMGELLTPEGLKKMSGMAVFPEKAVAKGDKWTSKSELSMPAIGKAAVETEFEYEGPETVDGKQLQKIAQRVTIKPDEKNANTAFKFQPLKTTGTMYFDNEAGRLVKNVGKTSFKADIEVMGQKLQQEGESTVRMEPLPAEKKE